MNEAVIDSLRHEANAKLDPKKKGALGQFMTPFKIAEFMAGMFKKRDGVVLLDAGAGIGSLTLAAASAVNVVRAEAWEIDPVMIGYLRDNLASLGVPFALHEKDFILDSVDRIQFDEGTRFTHAILNPPYKKISTESHHRQACRQVGLEIVNLYTAFFALAMLQMKDGGEIVIIIPRSFCNGPYYKPFRDLMLGKCSIDAIHVFESRSQAFKDDEVLQENIILKLTRGAKQDAVRLSYSRDASFSDLHSREVPFDMVVHPLDKERFIRIPRHDEDQDDDTDLFTHSLKDLGLEVCTGPVVDFRLKQWWSRDPQPGTVPCIYPHHFTKNGFEWPKEHKKPNSLLRSPEVDKWLMREGIYVIVRRFSAKEQRRRVVAYIVTPEDTKSELVGFENHWNVFHVHQGGLPLDIAKGLAAFLNTTVLDNYFRIFSGHTQVNATDLRNMKYPSLERLRVLGKHYRYGMEQQDIDRLLGE
ncbi:Eco57I restriction-modification methylase domain-containing protein [Piscinibacter sp.]|uniref:Eco57I restriction-modification methylase domain-containing protein n=1 Tax=Piscinibacter sp. TaxID=1903157 RepID=UPI0039E2A7C4